MQAIMAGAFHNPEMARQMVRQKQQVVEAGPTEDIEEQVKRTAIQRARKGKPEADPSVRDRIRARAGGDDIMSLGDLVEEIEEKDADG